jgi:hypothetical protein
LYSYCRFVAKLQKSLNKFISPSINFLWFGIVLGLKFSIEWMWIIGLIGFALLAISIQEYKKKIARYMPPPAAND